MENNQELDENVVLKLLNDTCNEMAKKIQKQQIEIRRLRQEREEDIETAGGNSKNFRVN